MLTVIWHYRSEVAISVIASRRREGRGWVLQTHLKPENSVFFLLSDDSDQKSKQTNVTCSGQEWHLSASNKCYVFQRYLSNTYRTHCLHVHRKHGLGLFLEGWNPMKLGLFHKTTVVNYRPYQLRTANKNKADLQVTDLVLTGVPVCGRELGYISIE